MSELTTSHTKCKCTACGHHFKSTAAFDKHRTGSHGVDRRCMDEIEMLAHKMARNVGGYWVTSLFVGESYWSK